MFERFTSGSRAVVETAQKEARTAGHGYVGTEHLLLGLLVTEGVAARVLSDAGLTAEAVRADLERRVGDALVSGPDAEALRAIGIEVAEVRARVEESFGPGALERARFGGRCRSRPLSGHVPFSPRAKKVLELSLREAIRLHHNYIGTEHILLGLLREGEGLAARILADSGVRADDLRNSVLAALGKVA